MASIQYVVSATDLASAVFAKIAKSADGLDTQLADLSKRVATPEVTLKDAKFTAGIISAAKRIDKLSAMMAEPGVNLEDGKFQAEIIKINAQLDRLDARHVDVSVGVHRGALSRLGGLLGGGGAGGAASAAGAAGAGLPALGGLGGTGGIAAVVAAIAALPFAAQAAAGGITLALGGALTGLGILSAASAKRVKADWTGLFSQTKVELRQVVQPFVGALKQISQVGQSVLPTIMMSLVGPMKVLAPAFQTIADSLLRSFAQPAVAASMQAVASAFGDILKALAPQLPGDIKDIAVGIERIANAVAKNPGAFAAIISFFFKATGFALSMVAALTSVANYIEKHFIPALMDIKNGWDQARHQTAVILDGMRHQVAHVWDMIFQNTIGTVIRLAHNVETQFNSLRHGIASTFDTIRHDVAAAWDTIWNNTVGRVQRGVRDVLHWVSTIPGGIKRIFASAGTWLLAAGRNVIQGLLNGLTAIWKKVQSFISGIASWIKAHKGPVSLDAHLLEPAGRALMNGLLSGLVGGFGPIAGFIGGAAGKIGSLFAHLGGSGVSRWAPLVLQVLRMLGQPAGALGIVLSQIATESGGNPRAINLTDINAQRGDPSRGLLQTIGSTFNAYAGPFRGRGIYDPLANVFAGLNYAIHRYGRTGWMSVLGHGHGYALGGTITEPILGFGRSGQMYTFGERGPETVIPGAGRTGGGALVHVDTMVVQDATDAELVAHRLNFAIYAASLGS